MTTASNEPTPQMLFEYTAGRWLYNEREQNSQRYREFDITALSEIASEAVGSKCTTISKGVEGSYNKVFFLDFENQSRALARIPNPIAGPSHLTVASEVATLDFALKVLRLPVPRVITWSGATTREKNDVGSDFIIMEVVPGVALNDRRKTIKGDEEVFPHLHELVGIESKFESITFSQHGSIYFKDDVSAELQQRPLFAGEVPESLKPYSDRYRLGPVADRQWWRNERPDMDLDRGPWPDAVSVFQAALQNQKKWIEKYAESSQRFRRTPFHPASYHLALLDMAIQGIPHILPKGDLCSPTLWHPDLSVGNIHVSSSGVPHIEGIIDWQHTCVLPYFYQAPIPPAIISDDDPFDLITPDNLDEFSLEEQEDLLVRQRLFNRYMWYKKHIVANNERRKKVIEGPIQGQLMTLLYCGQRTWFDSILELRQALLDIKENWTKICTTGVACPISFSEEEKAEHEDQWSNFVSYRSNMSQIDQLLDIEGDGWVADSSYANTREKLAEIKAIWKIDEQNGYPFPYDDGQFSFFLT